MAVTGQTQSRTQTYDGLIHMYYNNSKGQPVYVGDAEPGTAVGTAEWRIRKLTYDTNGSVLTELLAGGKKDFATTWTGRASATYS